VVTLGCGRNEVDSEELAGRLSAGGWQVADPESADVLLVNTCGFVEAAKKDSIDTLLAAADTGAKVVAVGCLAERYGAELAASLPEADAVLGFDAYPEITARLEDVLAGRPVPAHQPRDRRTRLPISPVERPAAVGAVPVPGHGPAAGSAVTTRATTGRPAEPAGSRPTAGGSAAWPADDPAAANAATNPAASGRPAEPAAGGPIGAPAAGRRAGAGRGGRGWAPPVLRRRLDDGPVAPLKLASGCDRRCSFCAIPSFRGAFVSRPPDDVLAEARWLAGSGVREIVLVSENSTSYGKDLGDVRLLEALLPELAAVPGIVRVRVSYLQPAEMRPSLLAAIATTPGVAAYFDLSFQHASEPVLRRMRRFGSTRRFLDLVDQVRAANEDAGIRSNVIVGFPGEAAADVAELERFLSAARLDAVGVFGYSDEDGTEAASYRPKPRAGTVGRRVDRVSRLVEELTAQRAEERAGACVEVLVESVSEVDGVAEGRAAHQAPEVDGGTTVHGGAGLRVGDLVRARVSGAVGVDLVADYLSTISPAATPGRVAPARSGPAGAPRRRAGAPGTAGAPGGAAEAPAGAAGAS
jgi:ribosomal protein S12 methylthiotransferase RimO